MDGAPSPNRLTGSENSVEKHLFAESSALFSIPWPLLFPPANLLLHFSLTKRMYDQTMPTAFTASIGKLLNLRLESAGRSLNTQHISYCNKFGRLIHMAQDQSEKSRGALIVLEGLDRSGKTSQSSRLVSNLESKGFPAELWRFPDRKTCVGEMISSYLSNKSQLDDQTVHLLFSANRWEKRSLMENKLRDGITLIVDRYSYSGVAFSAAKGLDIEWCKAPEKGLLAPDLVFYLEIQPERAAERGNYGEERYEQIEFQRKVAGCYQTLFDDKWKVVDAHLSLDDVEKQLKDLAFKCVESCRRGKSLSKLWI